MLLRPGGVLIEYPHGAPMAIDLTDLPPGTLRTVEWKGLPVWVLRRSPAMLQTLGSAQALLRDPHSLHSLQPSACRNAHRSLVPEWFVAIGLCTHQGCTPTLADAQGFLCPCHASRYDLAGRVFSQGPAERNLTIPDYRFDSPERLTLGVEA